MSDSAKYIPRPRPPRLTGDESFVLGGAPLPGSGIRDFWRWAFSSLDDNTLRGDLMEWAVAHLLGVPVSERGDWTVYDLMEGTTTIQVKQSSYLQGWAQKSMSAPRFDGLFKRPWDPDTNELLEKGYHCDWYIFALLECTNANLWDPLNLDQWSFYLVPRSTLQRYGYKGVSLGTLESLVRKGEARHLTAAELRENGRQVMGLDAQEAVVVDNGQSAG